MIQARQSNNPTLMNTSDEGKIVAKARVCGVRDPVHSDCKIPDYNEQNVSQLSQKDVFSIVKELHLAPERPCCINACSRHIINTLKL